MKILDQNWKRRNYIINSVTRTLNFHEYILSYQVIKKKSSDRKYPTLTHRSNFRYTKSAEIKKTTFEKIGLLLAFSRVRKFKTTKSSKYYSFLLVILSSFRFQLLLKKFLILTYMFEVITSVLSKLFPSFQAVFLLSYLLLLFREFFIF